MRKVIWMNPEGELIECSSHNEYAIDLISNSEEIKELNIDYDYPYQLLHKLGWVRIEINTMHDRKVWICGDSIDLTIPMRNTLDPRMNESQMCQAKRICIEYGITLHKAINDKRFW